MDKPLDSKSSASTNSATLAKITFIPQTPLSRKPRPALPSVPDSRKKGKRQQSRKGPILPPGELPGGLSSGTLSSHCNTCGEDGRRGGKRAWEMRKGESSPRISPPPLAQQQPLAVGTRLQHFADLHGHLAPGLQPVTHRGQLFTRHGQHDTARGLGIEYDAFHCLIH